VPSDASPQRSGSGRFLAEHPSATDFEPRSAHRSAAPGRKPRKCRGIFEGAWLGASVCKKGTADSRINSSDIGETKAE